MAKPNREAVRRFVAGALCDLIGHLDELDDPIIVGGRYPKDRLILAFYEWCEQRGVSVKDPDATGWLTACKSGALTAQDGPTRPPKRPEPPAPPAPPEPEVEPEDNVPEEGFFEGDSWKPPEEPKKPWFKQGEDWKDDDDEPSHA